MKDRKFLVSTVSAAALLLSAPFLTAQNCPSGAACTDPVGFVTLGYLGNSDTIMSFPLNRGIEFQGEVDSVSDGSTESVISLSTGSATLTPGDFAGGADTFYVKPVSGTKEGMFYIVTANDSGTITVENAGDTLSGSLDGELIQVIAFWTLDTVFPGGDGIAGSPTFSPVASVLFPDLVTAGTNLSISASFFYYTGAAAGGPGWRKVGASPFDIFGDTIVFPDTYVILRDSSGVSGETELKLLGTVGTSSFSTPLNVLSETDGQDNAVSYSFPIDLTLSQSQLFESGAFAGSASFSPVDSLLIFDPAVEAVNKSASASYFYYTGAAAGGPGWRKVGDSPLTIHDDEVVLKTGSGFVIRKGATGAVETFVWTLPAPF